MAKVLGVVSNKGGTGKTTVVYNLGCLLADRGQRVCLIDGDPQQSLTFLFTQENRAKYGLQQMFIQADAQNSLSKTIFDRLSLIRSDDPQGEQSGVIVSFLRKATNHHAFLSLALEGIGDQFDYILIDTMGAQGSIQESVILASDMLVSPVLPNLMDVRELMAGLIPRLHSMLPIKPELPTITGKAFPPLKILFNRVQVNVVDQQKTEHFLANGEDFRKQLEGFPGLSVEVLRASLGQRVIFNKSLGQGLPAFHPELSDRTARTDAKAMLDAVVDELLPELTCDVAKEAQS